ncbi:Protein sll1483, partial [Caligus rogercresseyi]
MKSTSSIVLFACLVSALSSVAHAGSTRNKCTENCNLVTVLSGYKGFSGLVAAVKAA